MKHWIEPYVTERYVAQPFLRRMAILAFGGGAVFWHDGTLRHLFWRGVRYEMPS